VDEVFFFIEQHVRRGKNIFLKKKFLLSIEVVVIH